MGSKQWSPLGDLRRTDGTYVYMQTATSDVGTSEAGSWSFKIMTDLN